jgi:carbon monoxide dehydrogenase subunit G
MIEVSERVVVSAAPRAVWDILSDPRAVAECVEGAELGEQHEDGSYDAKLVVKFGPARVSFKTRFRLELDDAAMSGRVESRGKDNQGGTRVKATMTFKVVAGEAAGSSAIPIDAQVEISGKLASLVETGANIVVKRMTADFTERLAAKVGGVAAN